MKYRAEIDGLRAIAVLPVIFFHAGFSSFGGGFVGVDVFFVISGYLITSILLSEKAAGNFSLIHFYERRARRILPALYTVMLISAIAAWFWLMPSDMHSFAKSVFAVSIFASNILFWLESGYFGVAVDLKPLLHTWSLAVEEQYYLLFPLMLIFLWKYQKASIGLWLVGLTLGSLVISEWGASYAPDAAFFLLPFRAWEILIGALIAYYTSENVAGRTIKNPPPIVKEAAAALGLSLILYAVFSFDSATRFPGLNAVIPTLGAALVILYASTANLTGRLLSHKLLVGIGLISYSLYLWHQPLFAFSRHTSLKEPSSIDFALLILASFALAILSWRYIEKPFRNKIAITPKALWLFAAGGTFVFICFGLIGYYLKGYPKRGTELAERAIQISERMSANYGLHKDCKEFTLSPNCRTHENPKVLLWGDSYAMHLAQGLVASNPDIRLIQMTKSACAPISGIAIASNKYSENFPAECNAFNAEVLQWLEKNSTVKYAVLSSPFTANTAEGAYVERIDGEKVPAKEASQTHLKETLAALHRMGITPVIVSPPPRGGYNIGHCLSNAIIYGRPVDACSIDKDENTKQLSDVIEFLRQSTIGYKFIDLSEGLCADDSCQTFDGDILIYRDGGHLSREGSAYVGKKMDFYKAFFSE